MGALKRSYKPDASAVGKVRASSLAAVPVTIPPRRDAAGFIAAGLPPELFLHNKEINHARYAYGIFATRDACKRASRVWELRARVTGVQCVLVRRKNQSGRLQRARYCGLQMACRSVRTGRMKPRPEVQELIARERKALGLEKIFPTIKSTGNRPGPQHATKTDRANGRATPSS